MVFLVGEARSNGNSGYCEVEDDEEDSGSEPDGEGSASAQAGFCFWLVVGTDLSGKEGRHQHAF